MTDNRKLWYEASLKISGGPEHLDPFIMNTGPRRSWRDAIQKLESYINEQIAIERSTVRFWQDVLGDEFEEEDR